MYTRQKGNSQLISTENPEDLLREARRNSMATPAQQQDPRNDQHRDNSDNEEENGPPRDIPVLCVPDLCNTILSKAIKDGMQVGNTGTEYIIHTPQLKDIMGIEWLKVTPPSGELETCSDPPLDFVTKCQPTPFNIDLLRGALKNMRRDNPELQFLSGNNWPPTHTHYLRREELEERLGAYCELSIRYAY